MKSLKKFSKTITAKMYYITITSLTLLATSFYLHAAPTWYNCKDPSLCILWFTDNKDQSFLKFYIVREQDFLNSALLPFFSEKDKSGYRHIPYDSLLDSPTYLNPTHEPLRQLLEQSEPTGRGIKEMGLDSMKPEEEWIGIHFTLRGINQKKYLFLNSKMDVHVIPKQNNLWLQNSYSGYDTFKYQGGTLPAATLPLLIGLPRLAPPKMNYPSYDPAQSSPYPLDNYPIYPNYQPFMQTNPNAALAITEPNIMPMDSDPNFEPVDTIDESFLRANINTFFNVEENHTSDKAAEPPNRPN